MAKITRPDEVESRWDVRITYRIYRDPEGTETRVEWLPHKRQLEITETWGGLERWTRRASPEAIQASVSEVMAWLPTGGWTQLETIIRAESLAAVRDGLERFRDEIRIYGPPKTREPKKARHGTLLFRYDEPPKLPFQSLLGVFISRDWLFLDEDTYRANLYIAEMRWDEHEEKWCLLNVSRSLPDCSLVCWASNDASFA